MMNLKNSVMKYRAVPVVTGLVTVATPFMSFAAEGDSVTTSVSSVMGIITSVMSLFTQFPMNLFIAGGLIVMGLRIFGQGKRVSKN